MRLIFAWLALGCCGLAPVAAQESGGARAAAAHIRVVGSAQDEVRPDIAVLNLGVVDEKPTAQDAMAENSRLTAAAIATVKGLGVDAKDIRTASVDLWPIMVDEHDPKTHAVTGRTLRGYRAENMISVTIRDLDKAGAIATKVVAAGANTYRGLSFDISDEDKKLDDLRAKAVADAMRKARLYASGASMKVGRLLAIDADPNRHPVGVQKFAARAAAPAGGGAPIPIEPGVRQLRLEVSTTWELVPE
jgi:uncharacterized protein YggE